MEKRAFKRQILDHPAQFSSPSHSPQDCVIKDFCKGGLFISYEYQQGELLHSSTPLFRVDDEILISFHADKPLHLNYQLQARVRRVVDGAMGLAITQDHPEAIHALYLLAKDTKEDQPAAVNRSEDHQQILQKCRTVITGFLSSCTTLFFEHLKDELMLAASDSGNKTEESRFFDTIALLDKYNQRIDDSFQSAAISQVDNWIAGKPVGLPEIATDTESNELSLVDKQDFEDWLLIKVIIARAEQQLKEALYQLELRMSAISPNRISSKNNPVSPVYICHSFYQAIHSLQLDHDIAEVVARVFDQQVVAKFETLYETLNTGLIRSGILPKISYRTVKQEQPAESPSEARNASIGDADRLQESDNPQHSPSDDTVVPIHSAQSTTVNSISNADSSQQEASVDHQSLQPANTSSLQAYRTAHELITLQRPEHTQLAASVKSDSPSLDVSAAPDLDQDYLLSQLTRLQLKSINEGDQISNQPLATRIKSCLEGNEKHLSERDAATIEVAENFCRSMLTNETLIDSIKPAFRQLEIPLLKILLQDESFFEDERHPARQVLNRLATLGMKGGQLKKSNQENIQHLVHQVVENFDRDPYIFNEVLKGLDSLIENQQQLAIRNTERVVQSCDGLQSIEKAKRTVTHFIHETISGQSIPNLLLSLIEQGWRELLVFTLLRDGANSAIWQSYTHVIEQLAQANPQPEQNSEIVEQGSGMLQIIEAGIKQAPSGQNQLRKLLPALRDMLTPGPDSPAPDFIEVNEAQLSPENAFADMDDDTLMDQALSRWSKRAKRLSVGDWVEFGETDDYLQIRLAWVGEDHHKFVFVNQQGMKVLEFTLREMTDHLQGGSARVINTPDQPFVDKSLDHVIQQMYEEMNYQSTHNELTGLINRKEFERQLNRALASAKVNELEHVICHLDLDQFNVINNACGHDAGNQLLGEIAGLIKSHSPADSLIAHLGGDEFALLLENSDLDRAQTTAVWLMEQIQNHRFIREDKTYTVGVSIGLASMDDTCETVSSVIDAADSARLSAKEAGRNRVHIYRPDDAEQAKRDAIMDKIAILNKALDEERLQLRCQRIEPVNPDSPEKPHYEILLSVEDELGVHMAPAEFIHAAERYNRMQAVDRWVIHNVFQWMATNRHKIEALGGCTINLSGQSLNDEGLMSYIFDELSKTSVPCEKVCFEITETAAVTNLADVSDFINEMKNLGFRFAMDDFGSGLSSYMYLKSLPVDYLKIDGAFVKNIATDAEDYAMVKSINEMAHLMGKKTVAEYVEDEAALEKLREIGVDFAQGYGIEKPQLLDHIASKAA